MTGSPGGPRALSAADLPADGPRPGRPGGSADVTPSGAGWPTAAALAASAGSVDQPVLSTRAPERAQHRRLRSRVLLPAALGAVAVVVLADNASAVDLSGAVSDADPRWAALAAVASLLPFLGAAISLSALTPGRLPLRTAVAAQVAASFVSVALPPAVGQAGVTARLLFRLGRPAPVAAVIVGLTQVSSVAVTLVVLAVAVPVASGPAVATPPAAALAAVLLLGLVPPAALLSRRVRHRLGAGSESGLRRRLCGAGSWRHRRR